MVLDPICTGSNPISYMKSQGYQKVAGDVCVGGVQEDYLPIETACCKLQPGGPLLSISHLHTVSPQSDTPQ